MYQLLSIVMFVLWCMSKEPYIIMASLGFGLLDVMCGYVINRFKKGEK